MTLANTTKQSVNRSSHAHTYKVPVILITFYYRNFCYLYCCCCGACKSFCHQRYCAIACCYKCLQLLPTVSHTCKNSRKISKGIWNWRLVIGVGLYKCEVVVFRYMYMNMWMYVYVWKCASRFANIQRQLISLPFQSARRCSLGFIAAGFFQFGIFNFNIKCPWHHTQYSLKPMCKSILFYCSPACCRYTGGANRKQVCIFDVPPTAFYLHSISGSI